MKLTQFPLRNPLVVAGRRRGAVPLRSVRLLRPGRGDHARTSTSRRSSSRRSTRAPTRKPSRANVTRPIEDAIAALPNIDTNGLTSISSPGVSIVIVQFTTAANPDLVAVDVQRVVNGVRAKLPADVEAPSVSKVDINAFGVATVVLSGQQPLDQLQDVAENSSSKQFNAVPGVGATDDPLRASRARCTSRSTRRRCGRAACRSTSVISALQSQQLEMPAGTIAQGTTRLQRLLRLAGAARRVAGRHGRAADADRRVLPARRRDDRGHLQDAHRPSCASTARRASRWSSSSCPTPTPSPSSTASSSEIAQLEPQLPPDTQPGHRRRRARRYTTKSFNTVRNALLEAVAGHRADPAAVPAHLAQHADRAGLDPGVAARARSALMACCTTT